MTVIRRIIAFVFSNFTLIFMNGDYSESSNACLPQIFPFSFNISVDPRLSVHGFLFKYFILIHLVVICVREGSHGLPIPHPMSLVLHQSLDSHKGVPPYRLTSSPYPNTQHAKLTKTRGNLKVRIDAK